MDLEAVSQCNSEILCAQVAMLLEKKHEEEEEEEKTQPFLMKPCYCALLSFSFSEDFTEGLPTFPLTEESNWLGCGLAVWFPSVSRRETGRVQGG